MKQIYKNKLSHLSIKDTEDLVWFYYGGIEEEILISDYEIDLADPSLLYKTFPLVIDSENRTCPHCHIPLLAFQVNRTSFQQEVFCEQCDSKLAKLYNCHCEICTQALSIVEKAIRKAFKGVKLGSGVGLYEAVGIDDYASAEERQRLRQNDELDNWDNIPLQRLNECYSSLSFFDAAGMRFHLPAYMLAELKKPQGSNANVLFLLTGPTYDKAEKLKDHSARQLSLLNQQQRAAVALFLQFCLTRLEYDLDAAAISKALNEYWN